MGHESRIELWSPHLTAFCFAGFGTDRLRRAKVMKTAGRENPNRWGNASSNRAPGAEVQNSSYSIMWAGKQEKVRLLQGCFFLTFLFIELIRTWPALVTKCRMTLTFCRTPAATGRCRDTACGRRHCLRAQLILWRDNDAKLQPLMQRLGLLRSGVAEGRESIGVANCGHIIQRKAETWYFFALPVRRYSCQ
jgi:hypothetical protein